MSSLSLRKSRILVFIIVFVTLETILCNTTRGNQINTEINSSNNTKNITHKNGSIHQNKASLSPKLRQPPTTSTKNLTKQRLSRKLCGPDFMDIHRLICKLKELKKRMAYSACNTEFV